MNVRSVRVQIKRFTFLALEKLSAKCIHNCQRKSIPGLCIGGCNLNREPKHFFHLNDSLVCGFSFSCFKLVLMSIRHIIFPPWQTREYLALWCLRWKQNDLSVHPWVCMYYIIILSLWSNLIYLLQSLLYKCSKRHTSIKFHEYVSYAAGSKGFNGLKSVRELKVLWIPPHPCSTSFYSAENGRTQRCLI